MPKISSFKFLGYYWFHEILDIGMEEFNWTTKERGDLIIKICQHYRDFYCLNGYSNVQIWKIIKKKWINHFDIIHWHSMQD